MPGERKRANARSVRWGKDKNGTIQPEHSQTSGFRPVLVGNRWKGLKANNKPTNVATEQHMVIAGCSFSKNF